MSPNKIISGLQLEQYLRNYFIDIGLSVIHYNEDYSLNNYIEEINTTVLYKNVDIVEEDINFTDITTKQEKDLILYAINLLRERVI